jgi:hypothetical protein
VGGARLEGVSAGALYFGVDVIGVNSLFWHGVSP